jgi:hypothetical protein
MHREQSRTQHEIERKAYDEAIKKANGTWEKEQEELRVKEEAERKKKEAEEAWVFWRDFWGFGIFGAVKKFEAFVRMLRYFWIRVACFGIRESLWSRE